MKALILRTAVLRSEGSAPSVESLKEIGCPTSGLFCQKWGFFYDVQGPMHASAVAATPAHLSVASGFNPAEHDTVPSVTEYLQSQRKPFGSFFP